MDRHEAEEALALVRQVVEKIHDTAVLQNWGHVMVIVGLLDLGAFGLTHLLWTSGVESWISYTSVWGAYLALALVANLTVRKRMGGSNTYVERHVWVNGVTFYLASFAIVAVDLHSLPVAAAMDMIPAHIAIVGAISFAFMALLDLRFIACTVVFFFTSLLVSYWTSSGFLLLGAAWCICLVTPGVRFIIQKRRLLSAGDYTEAV